ncbi:hypothetical protein BsIDN1_28250 [Bacillus safensis]|uniref:Uncharacterized protein n=1 Tax=Bacillus safensis TaxID=561879 RepID=A0A5S9M6S1_BACIA|nr:hypothetical protein BsIDN1_28250 [Bacillus safensis]
MKQAVLYVGHGSRGKKEAQDKAISFYEKLYAVSESRYTRNLFFRADGPFYRRRI